MTVATVAAADLGGSSGRVMLARIGRDLLELTETHRFANDAAQLGPTLHWDVPALYRGVLDGLRAAGRTTDVDAVGIDSWAVDYGLLDATGALLGNPVSYRDRRPTASWTRSTPGSARSACTPSPAHGSCRSTRSTSSPPPAAHPCSRRPGVCCRCRTCSRTG